MCGSLLPTGRLLDRFDDVEVTCIDNGMPVVMIAAESLGVTGYESRDALNADTKLKQRIESIRSAGGPADESGRCRHKVVPKMCLVARPSAPAAIFARAPSFPTIAMPPSECSAR